MTMTDLEKELAKRIGKFMRELKEDGLATHCSTVLVWGNGETGDNGLIPFFEGDSQFDSLTVHRLDSLVAQVKVKGFSPERTVLTDESGEMKEFQTHEEFIEYMNNQGLSVLKESFDTMSEHEGTEFARDGLAKGITLTVAKSNDWLNLSTEEKLDKIAETIAHLQSFESGNWLPDFTDLELTKAIQFVDHIVKFGYPPQESGNDVAFA